MPAGGCPLHHPFMIKEKLIVRQIGSSLLALAAAAALFAAPAFAQSSGGSTPAPAPAPAAPAAAPPAAAPAMAPGMKMAPAKTAAAKPKHKFSCYDYAWQSKQMQDCLAKASAKPAAKPAAAKKPAAKAAPAKKPS